MSQAITSLTAQRNAAHPGRADLHIHTLYSDGGQAPEGVMLAAARRLDVVAITDHDRIAGAVRARDDAREHPDLGVDVVVGGPRTSTPEKQPALAGSSSGGG